MVELIGSGRSRNAVFWLVALGVPAQIAALQSYPLPERRAPFLSSFLKLTSNWSDGVIHLLTPRLMLSRLVCSSKSDPVPGAARRTTVGVVVPGSCMPALMVRGLMRTSSLNSPEYFQSPCFCCEKLSSLESRPRSCPFRVVQIPVVSSRRR